MNITLPSPLTLTREQLHARVWSTSTVQLAHELGVSDVAFAKLCRRRNIPRPTRGYWAKIAAGHSPVPVTLPPASAKEDRPAVFQRVFTRDVVALPPEGERLHPIAERVRRCLVNYKKDYRGLVRVEEHGLPRVAVSPALAGRATRALHVVLATADACGDHVTMTSAGALALQRGEQGITVSVSIEEALSTHFDAKDRPVRRPSGQLVFSLGELSGKRSSSKRWAESTYASLETVLARLLTALDRLLRNRRPAPLSQPASAHGVSDSLAFAGASTNLRRDVA